MIEGKKEKHRYHEKKSSIRYQFGIILKKSDSITRTNFKNKKDLKEWEDKSQLEALRHKSK